MENAGRQVAPRGRAVAGGLYGSRAVVVCGKGNNGGDGLVAARYLARWGIRVTVLMLEVPEDLREPADTNVARLADTDVRVRPFSRALLARELARSDVAIDAIFGTGFRGFPEEEWADAIDGLNEGGVAVVAVDIPSGVNGDTGAVEGEAVWADVDRHLRRREDRRRPAARRRARRHRRGRGHRLPARPASRATCGCWRRRTSPRSFPPARSRRTSARPASTLVVGGSRLDDRGRLPRGRRGLSRRGGTRAVAVPETILPVVQSLVREATFLPLPETAGGHGRRRSRPTRCRS